MTSKNWKRNIFLSPMYIVKILFIAVFISAWVYSAHSEDVIRLDFKLTTNIYLDSQKVDNTYFLYESDTDISGYSLSSQCEVNSKFIWKNRWYYLFKVRYLDDLCDDGTISLIDSNSQIIRNESLNIVKKSYLYDYFLDFSTQDLETFKNTLIERKSTLVSSLNNDSNIRLQQQRKIDEWEYVLWIISHIILQRKEKYIIPVEWGSISENPSRVPNAGRPYREDITDGIHHWWDVYWPLEDKTIALGDALVIRVVRDFEYSDLWKLNRSSVLSELDEAKNLDIYRWNQVWLKTMKWDVVFYSHLTEISDTIVEWKIINQGDFIWTTGITGVPDKNYTDYHLHFTIHKNPNIPKKAWKNTIDDYLLWDWYFKWEPISYVLQNQNKVFTD